MAKTNDLPSRGDLLRALIRYRDIAADQGTKIFRLRTALLLVAEFLCTDTPLEIACIIADWVEDGMDNDKPIRWPTDPLVDRWLRQNGYNPVGGYIGMTATAEIIEHHHS